MHAKICLTRIIVFHNIKTISEEKIISKDPEKTEMKDNLVFYRDAKQFKGRASDADHSSADQNDQARFERLISDISVRFINIHPDQVNKKIEEALNELLVFFNVDGCQLLRESSDRSVLEMTHCAYKGVRPRVPASFNLKELFPWSAEKLSHNEVVSISTRKNLPPEAETDRRSHEKWMSEAILDVPISVQGSVDYDIVLSSRTERTWPQEYIPRLRLIGEVFVNALLHRKAYKKLQDSYAEVKRLKDLLQAENDYLHFQLNGAASCSEIIGKSNSIKSVMMKVQQVASSNSTVLIQGETGTGKELVAKAIHNMSCRKEKRMIKVDCTSLPPSLIEGELFGREKGAYTGALFKQLGRFEVADGSTIFFDEIGELPLELQGKLLRVLQDREFERLGSTKTIRVNVRIIAATNRNLEEEVQKGKFREDLYYRLNVFQIYVPPLRERSDDIPLLMDAFIQEFTKEMGKVITKVPTTTVDEMKRYHWPGNIRELRNVIENAVITSSHSTLNVKLPSKAAGERKSLQALKDVELQHIKTSLEKTNWRIKGPQGAAKLLGLKPSTLYNKMKRLEISVPRNKKTQP